MELTQGSKRVGQSMIALAVWCSMLNGVSPEKEVRIEVLRAKATIYAVGDPDVLGIKLEFAIRVTNVSTKAIELPKGRSRDRHRDQVSILGVEARRPDGSWAYVFRGSWYDAGNLDYSSCQVLHPGRSLEIHNLAGGFALPVTQLNSMGQVPTVRLYLMLFCRQADGHAASKVARTEELELLLPHYERDVFWRQ